MLLLYNFRQHSRRSVSNVHIHVSHQVAASTNLSLLSTAHFGGSQKEVSYTESSQISSPRRMSTDLISGNHCSSHNSLLPPTLAVESGMNDSTSSNIFFLTFMSKIKIIN